MWLPGMNMSRSFDGAYLSLTQIGTRDYEASFSTADYFDDWRAAKDAIIDVSRDGRLLGIEWLGSNAPEVVRPDVQYRPADNHALVWLVDAQLRSVATTVRVPADDSGVPGDLDLHFDASGGLIGIEAHDAARQLPRSLLEAAASFES